MDLFLLSDKGVSDPWSILATNGRYYSRDGRRQDLRVWLMIYSYFQTRELVTHGVHWLPMVDTKVVMVDSKISEYGYDLFLLSDKSVSDQWSKMATMVDTIVVMVDGKISEYG